MVRWDSAGRPASVIRMRNNRAFHVAALLGPLLMTAGPAAAQTSDIVDRSELKVCADPNNLPFSDEKKGGFENKIAELVTQDLGAQLSYTWWPHQRGLVRRTLNQDLCDVLIGIPKGYDPVLWTTPYYRTAYVIASLKERGLQIT